LLELVDSAAADLPPGCFAFVMATGIVAVAAEQTGLAAIAGGLAAIGAMAYAALGSLLAVRLVRHRRRVAADLADPMLAPGFFTVAAATAVLGADFTIVVGWQPAAVALWFVALAIWLVSTYAVFFFAIVGGPRASGDAGPGGAWLLACVATQGIAVLGTAVAAFFADPGPAIGVSLGAFMLGALLYLALITLVLQRLVFLGVSAKALTPPYWISMGAAAISTLAGASLILDGGASPAAAALLPFLEGLTLLFWTAGTWWIPLLAALAVWRHLVRHEPLVYDVQLWSMVFPLGMYSAATRRLSEATALPLLAVVAQAFFWIALLSWAWAAAGTLSAAARARRGRQRPA